MTIVPMQDLKDIVEIERKCENGPIFITKNGYGRLVVMDIDYYERTMLKIHEAKALNEGLSDIQSGNTIEGNEIKDKLSKKYGL